MPFESVASVYPRSLRVPKLMAVMRSLRSKNDKGRPTWILITTEGFQFGYPLLGNEADSA